jgi:hypothetical protein
MGFDDIGHRLGGWRQVLKSDTSQPGFELSQDGIGKNRFHLRSIGPGQIHTVIHGRRGIRIGKLLGFLDISSLLAKESVKVASM